MRLFAQRGVAAVSVRAIAAAAGVSAPLVIHHFGSKAGLKSAVDEHAVAVLRSMFDLADDPGVQRGEYGEATNVMAAILDREPALLPYLRRLLVDGGDPAEQLFRWLHEMTVAQLVALRERGLLRAGSDPEDSEPEDSADAVRAAFLLVNDLGVVLLREQIRAVVGHDPLAGAGLQRWSATVFDVYSRGLLQVPGEEGTDA